MDLLAEERMLRALRLMFWLLMSMSFLLTSGQAGEVMPLGTFDGYGLSSFDYFGVHLGAVEKNIDVGSDDLWNEVRVFPGGGMEVYRPPKPVLDFLNSPTPEGARRYLKWNERRFEKIAIAQKVLDGLSSPVEKDKGVHR